MSAILNFVVTLIIFYVAYSVFNNIWKAKLTYNIRGSIQKSIETSELISESYEDNVQAYASSLPKTAKVTTAVQLCSPEHLDKILSSCNELQKKGTTSSKSSIVSYIMNDEEGRIQNILDKINA